MATAVQGKVPAHKGPVNHEVESDDDVDEDDVRSLPALLLFHDARNARRGKGVPRNPHRSPIRSSRVADEDRKPSKRARRDRARSRIASRPPPPRRSPPSTRRSPWSPRRSSPRVAFAASRPPRASCRSASPSSTGSASRRACAAPASVADRRSRRGRRSTRLSLRSTSCVPRRASNADRVPGDGGGGARGPTVRKIQEARRGVSPSEGNSFVALADVERGNRTLPVASRFRFRGSPGPVSSARVYLSARRSKGVIFMKKPGPSSTAQKLRAKSRISRAPAKPQKFHVDFFDLIVVGDQVE